jgi:CubicO group peptidase (beta-lactamase class C family)
MLRQAVDEGVAPALVFLAWRDGEPVCLLAAGRAVPETVFDLASLTKPLAAALIALDLKARDLLPWSASLGDIWGPPVPADKKEITVRRLLTHSAGYAAYRPFFTLLEKQPPLQRKGLLKAMLLNEPLERRPGQKAVYSDLGYMLLGLVLEHVGGQSLADAARRVYRELGVEGPRFLPVGEEPPWPLEMIAPCGPLPGRPTIHGQVEDENAFALGGAAGHAGLFGSARQVAELMDALCRADQGDGPWPAGMAGELWRVDPDTPGSGRTPGFDTPEGPTSAAGENPPPGTAGHLGFTGVSLWWRPEVNQGLVLLTNRAALGRDNEKIKDFRRRLHTLAWPLLQS